MVRARALVWTHLFSTANIGFRYNPAGPPGNLGRTTPWNARYICQISIIYICHLRLSSYRWYVYVFVFFSDWGIDKSYTIIIMYSEIWLLPQVEPKALRPANMVSTSTQKHISFIRDLQIPLVSTLWLVVYSEFLFSALGQNFFDVCTDTVNPYFAEGT